MDASLLAALREKKPLIHCISNIVTANDCANLLLAVGASPMMAQAPEEMEEISAAVKAVVLNTGTPSGEKFAACLRAGRTACRAGIPVVLDPVGVGASHWRLGHVQMLLKEVHPAILRVNYGEAAALLRGGQTERGWTASRRRSGTPPQQLRRWPGRCPPWCCSAALRTL